MKLDNFTTARCSKCGWKKQYQPGAEYSASDFDHQCKQIVEPKKIEEKTVAKTRTTRKQSKE